jgi:hypothetical protein
MITLYGRIREKLISSGNTRNYLLYAVGEILLALQINNRNELNKKEATSQTHIRSLKSDLQSDVANFEKQVKGLNTQLARIDSIEQILK